MAQNVYSSVSPDNDGIILDGDHIIPNANDLHSTLDLNKLNLISGKSVKSEISENAGKFMCNANFYWNQHKISTEKLNTKYLFIHIQ